MSKKKNQSTIDIEINKNNKSLIILQFSNSKTKSKEIPNIVNQKSFPLLNQKMSCKNSNITNNFLIPFQNQNNTIKTQKSEKIQISNYPELFNPNKDLNIFKIFQTTTNNNSNIKKSIHPLLLQETNIIGKILNSKNKDEESKNKKVIHFFIKASHCFSSKKN